MARQAVKRRPPASGNGRRSRATDVRLLPVDMIKPNPKQHRKHFDQDALRQLADSLAANGILENLVVRRLGRGFEIIAGERRWRASKLAGLTELPCRVIDADDARAYELSLVENVARADIRPTEEGRGYLCLMELGRDPEVIARAIGKTATHVHYYANIARTDFRVQQLVDCKQLAVASAWHLSRIENKERQFALAEIILAKRLTTQEVARLVECELARAGAQDLPDGEALILITQSTAAAAVAQPRLAPSQPLAFAAMASTSSPAETTDAERRRRWQRSLETVEQVISDLWDERMQQVCEAATAGANEADLQRVHLINQAMGKVAHALQAVVERKRAAQLLSTGGAS